MNLQPTHLQSDIIEIRPLEISDFEGLYKVSSDPLVWEQHPSNDRYKKEVFDALFKEAMRSNSAFAVIDKQNGTIIGSSRFYDLDIEKNSVAIGYTFIAREYWGKNYNKSLKHLMINYAFEYVANIIFHIGATNTRSQMAIGNIGAKKIGEFEMAYAAERKVNLNFVYRIKKEDWMNI
jgi:RimJ/RimL family protein N-acetyltransferase